MVKYLEIAIQMSAVSLGMRKSFHPLCSPAIHAAWSAWTSWSSCSTSCGPGVSPRYSSQFQVRTRVKGCDLAQHGGNTDACSDDQTEAKDCGNPCCECLTYKNPAQVKWMVGGITGGPGEAAPKAVPRGCREGAGSAITTAQPAEATRVLDPMINQGCAALSTAVSDLLLDLIIFNEHRHTLRMCIVRFLMLVPAIPATWGSWHGWMACSETCGGGVSLTLETYQILNSQAQNRTRRCNLAQYSGSTAVCTQDGQDTRACNTGSCREFRVEF